MSLFLRILFYSGARRHGDIDDLLRDGAGRRAAFCPPQAARGGRLPVEFLPPVHRSRCMGPSRTWKRTFIVSSIWTIRSTSCCSVRGTETDTGLQLAKQVAAQYPEVRAQVPDLRRAAVSECEDVVADGAERGGGVRDAGEERRRCAGVAGLSAAVRAGAGRSEDESWRRVCTWAGPAGGFAAQLDACMGFSWSPNGCCLRCCDT